MGDHMRTLHWMTFLAGLLVVTGTTRAAIVSIENVDVLQNAGEISVGVFLTNDSGAELLLGAYDVPIDFGAAGITAVNRHHLRRRGRFDHYPGQHIAMDTRPNEFRRYRRPRCFHGRSSAVSSHCGRRHREAG